MNVIDQFEAERGKPFSQLLPDGLLKGDSVGPVIAGHSAFVKVFLSVKAVLSGRPASSPLLHLLVEQSADGVTFDEVETFTFTDTAVALLPLNWPKDKMRVTATVNGLWTPVSVEVISGDSNAATSGFGYRGGVNQGADPLPVADGVPVPQIFNFSDILPADAFNNVILDDHSSLLVNRTGSYYLVLSPAFGPGDASGLTVAFHKNDDDEPLVIADVDDLDPDNPTSGFLEGQFDLQAGDTLQVRVGVASLGESGAPELIAPTYLGAYCGPLISFGNYALTLAMALAGGSPSPSTFTVFLSDGTVSAAVQAGSIEEIPQLEEGATLADVIAALNTLFTGLGSDGANIFFPAS